ncbi:AMP-binding protein [Nocardiopsis sp. HNM0947]|uniref:AMP-binding protein n=1 Tax=Nocardiopsis coralli TaxID=2772213 RepID=A0ABR9NZX5_9ACTN|nr:AMP-binding protein [Nocardiopsis coralli]MBE2997135.1 AMP-binding protein [Nocardiopsis coralli]
MTHHTSAGVVPWPQEFAERYRSEGRWKDRTLVDALTEAAARSDRTALVDGQVRIGYPELMDRVEAGAARLLRLGLDPDDRIVVQLPNGWQFVVLLLACFRAGIVPVMAMPAHRAHELTAIAEVAEARALAVPDELKGFDHRALARRVAEEVPTVEHVLVSGGDGDAGLEGLLAPGPVPGAAPVVSPDPGAVALFLLSGGTTGLPKLIARTHRDYEYNVRECARVSGLDGGSVYLAALPASHNFPLACPGLLGALFAGGTVVMLSSPEPARAFAAVAGEGVTMTAVVPAVAQRWLEHAEGSGGASALSSLSVLQVGGSRLPDEIAARVRPALGCTLQQVFGMAEGLINMTRLDDPEEVVTSTQGRPVSDADEVRIVDAFGQDLPDGRAGSILTRGPYTPRGHYRAPEADGRSFVEGWYSSGDIVLRRTDGNLVVQGRDKDLINRAGEKISAEEVESLVYRVADVEMAAAVAMPDPVMGERLCLYVTVREGGHTTLDEVRDTLSAAGLAAFKLPERLEVVDLIPMTKVGKIDKKHLREDISARLASGTSTV